MSLRQQFGGGENIPGAFNEDTVPGTVVHGTVTAVDVAQATEYVNAADRRAGKRGAPLFHPDGKPKLQVIITVDTGVKGHDGPDDDGRRRFYIKTWYKSDREAFFAALDAADMADDVEVGGKFAGRFDGKVNGNAWNSHYYEYSRPSKIAQAGLLDRPAEAAPPAAQPTLPIQQPAAPAPDPAAVAAALLAQQQQAFAPPAAPAVDPATAEAVRTLITGGLDDDTIAGAFPGVKRELIAALRSVGA